MHTFIIYVCKYFHLFLHIHLCIRPLHCKRSQWVLQTIPLVHFWFSLLVFVCGPTLWQVMAFSNWVFPSFVWVWEPNSGFPAYKLSTSTLWATFQPLLAHLLPLPTNACSIDYGTVIFINFASHPITIVKSPERYLYVDCKRWEAVATALMITIHTPHTHLFFLWTNLETL